MSRALTSDPALANHRGVRRPEDCRRGRFMVSQSLAMPKRPKALPQPIEVPDDEKLEILNRHSITGPGWNSLDETQWCLHCCKTFTGRSVRVYRDPGFPDGYSIECGTPGCDGSPIDWHEPDSDFAVGVTAQYADADRDGTPGDQPHEEVEYDPNYEDCGDYGPQVDITLEYRDEAQRQRFRPVLWQESGGPKKKLKVHPELGEMLRTAAKEAFQRVFTEHFGAAWMDQWKIVFRARVDGWADEPEIDEVIQVEVESASEIDDENWSEELFHQVCDLTEEEATEKALLEELQGAVVTYLNLYAPELVSEDEHLEMRMEISGYGGG